MSREDAGTLIEMLTWQLLVLLPFAAASLVYIWRTRGRWQSLMLAMTRWSL